MEADYGQYVGMMYNIGFYVRPYDIHIINEEISCSRNKIYIHPIISEDDKYVYVFTGNSQKRITPSDITEFKLYLEDENGEFKDNDNIMLSVCKLNETPVDLYTRSYAQWKFGVSFDKGIHMDSDKFLIFQSQKEITKFDIDIYNVDLFTYRHKRRKEDFNNEMTWVD